MENANITEQDARGLLPYPVIIAASKGDPDAMRIVVHHYESYIAFLSISKPSISYSYSRPMLLKKTAHLASRRLLNL